MNVNTVSVVLFALVLMLAFGCKKEDKKEDPQPTNTNPVDPTTKKLDPTITLLSNTTPTTAAVVRGSQIRLNFRVNKGADSNKLKSLNVQFTNSTFSNFNSGIITGFPRSIEGKTEHTEDLLFTADRNNERLTWVAYRITVSDSANRTASIDLRYTIRQPGDTTQTDTTQTDTSSIRLFNNVSLSSTTPHFSTSTGRTYTDSQGPTNASVIDISYFYSSASGQNISSAGARKDPLYASFQLPWGVHSVEYRELSITTQFNNIKTAAEIEAAFQSGTPTEVPNTPPGTRFNSTSGGFLYGNTFAFRTQNGNKYGLLRLERVGSGGPVGGAHIMSIKVQK